MQETVDRTARRSDLLTTPEAAEVLGTTKGTLTTWRCTRAVEIPYVKVGRNVRYRLSDLTAFLEAQTVKAEG